MRKRQLIGETGPAEIVQLDEALLDACGPLLRAELFAEAAMLAEAFAPEGRSEQLRAMAATLTAGARADAMDHTRARQLACALRCLARGVRP